MLFKANGQTGMAPAVAVPLWTTGGSNMRLWPTIACKPILDTCHLLRKWPVVRCISRYFRDDRVRYWGKTHYNSQLHTEPHSASLFVDTHSPPSVFSPSPGNFPMALLKKVTITHPYDIWHLQTVSISAEFPFSRTSVAKHKRSLCSTRFITKTTERQAKCEWITTPQFVKTSDYKQCHVIITTHTFCVIKLISFILMHISLIYSSD